MAASYTDYTSSTSKIKDFTFPYIKQSDIKVRKTTSAGVVTELVEGTATGASPGQYTWTNATRLTLNDAPVSADTIRVYRDTASDALVGTFYPGSAIRSSDLNDNFTQNLYVTQEAEDSVDTANTSATAANTTADAAKATADDAADDVKRWIKDGDGTDTAGNEDDADFTARPLKPQGIPYAVAQVATANTTAGNAVTTANGAVTTANGAVTTANGAVTTANAAVVTANSASSAVSSVLPYTIIAGAAELQALFGGSDSPTADDIFEITETDDLPVKILSAAWAGGTAYKINDQRTNDSGKLYLCTVAGTSAGSGGPTGTGSSITDNTITWKYIAAANGIWTISGTPSPMPTFSTGITVKLKYTSGDASASAWTWQSYHANNPETRYAPTDSPTLTSPTFITSVDIDGATQIDATVTVGVDDTGYDVKFFGDTASAYMLWDTSADDLILAGAAGLVVPDGQLTLGATAVTSTAAELNLVDGITAGTVSASKAVIVDASKDLTGLNDVTIAGNLTVNGTTTTIDTTNLTVEDPLISLAKNNNSSNTVDIGFYGLYDATGSQDVYTGLFRDANDSGKWKLFELNQAAPTTTVDVSGTGYAAATLVVGTLEDSKGDVRKIPENAKTTSYTLVVGDAGKHIKFTPGDASQTLTVPDSVFASGDAITIVNNSGNNLAIAKGTNMYYAADATNTNRTLAGRGVATLLFTAADTCYITGAGLS
jgi:hypothetical protein